MLFKSLEFKTNNGQKVKITDIPVLNEASPLFYKINIKLAQLVRQIHTSKNVKTTYSFRDYLKTVLRWPDYELIYQSTSLKNNA
ncbi:hypothetical protein AN964_09830 [Heyndrickxia shackletonii]|uniref:DUF2535 family protein n=1 Tax=Heyndrickxia shackletonii TaxID=157838 RepID=A0A0Q3TJP9_9BACI|nr:DUF2535 family protein [Heyndrickxia shackletonii]KQL53769.1 hypothetical protein AN964_09830 [Heyndrickxia shackletonii]MBB2481581.1 DUF2535 family protein [Bacillus sp. APMAM]NEY99921.1 DUF2535 family protein [Heyndrickxia shackletonii]RTZ55071.1 DUF2535 family protein [Bacillus sp. SAJ1]